MRRILKGSGQGGSLSPETPETLPERVQARVANATLALERRRDASQPDGPDRRVSSVTASEARPVRSEKSVAEESLRQVFRDLGRSYRRYRKQTGSPVIPALRNAATSFRAEPSLTTLVAVAAYLDELDLLS